MRISPRLLADTVTLLQPERGADPYGNDVALTWTQGPTVAAMVVPAEGTEDMDGRQAVVSVFEVYTDDPIPADYRVRWRGSVYTVTGPPKQYGAVSVSAIRHARGR
jgi:head-tail adaptor